MGKEKKEKKKDREAGAASEADVTMDTTATEVRENINLRKKILSQISLDKHAVLQYIRRRHQSCNNVDW
jgi:hypothetical protein